MRSRLVVAYCGRGAVVWRDGRIRFAGVSNQRRRELEEAVVALLEMEKVEVSSDSAVRDALLTIGGARILRDPHRTEAGVDELPADVALAAVAAARRNQQLIDELWDFAEPAASEPRFRAAAASATTNEQHAFLLTQVARAVGLQGRFDEALALLDGVPDPVGSGELAVRMDLERGRILNSSGSPGEARPLFEAAFSRASAAGFEHLAIDALHMVAIVAAPEDQAALNEQALAMARAATDARARDWRASLLNNLGWTRFDAGDLDEALALFEEAVEERARMGKARELGSALWSVGRVLRELGRADEALEAQLSLASWLADAVLADSFVEEEIGECLVAVGRPAEAAGHFGRAADLLEAAGPGEYPDPTASPACAA